MAMKYCEEMDSIFGHFRAAVEDTGFRLVKLDAPAEAGLINNRMRVEIRTSRFLVADLTHDNHGAYFVFTTVCWEIDRIEKAQQELKDVIRATRVRVRVARPDGVSGNPSHDQDEFESCDST